MKDIVKQEEKLKGNGIKAHLNQLIKNKKADIDKQIKQTFDVIL